MNNRKMSLWGVGPGFVISSLVITLLSGYFSWRYSEFFNIAFCRILFYIAAILFITAGLGLWLPAAAGIDDCIKRGILADRGVYGLVRNPIYSGIFFVITGICLAFHSVLMLACPVLIYFLLRFMIRSEEEFLEEHFGEEFLAYKKRVRPVIPSLYSVFTAFFYPEDTAEYEEGLFAIKDGDVNVFVFTDGTDWICIDAGYSPKRLADQLSRLGIEPERISALFLTHTDHDHRGGLELFRNASVYIGMDEEQMIDGTHYRILFYRNKPLSTPYNILRDNQTVKIGKISIRAVFTPGHTPGHTAYQVNERLLFSGDAVNICNGLVRPFYRFFNMNHKHAAGSVQKLSGVKGVKLLCTAHTGILGL